MPKTQIEFDQVLDDEFASQEELDAISGMSPETHKTLDQLVHIISENSYTEYIRTNNKVTSIIIWIDNNKTIKIREYEYIRTNNKVTSIIIKQYDELSQLLETYTTNIIRTNNKVTSITGVIS